MTKEQKAWIRSPRGQLSLLLAVFVGSALFSVGCALAREGFFERYVVEKFEAPPTHLGSLTPAQVLLLPPDERKLLYGERIDHGTGIDPAVLAERPEELHVWLRGTIVTGNPAQRRAATGLLPLLRGRGVDAELEATARYAEQRAVRLGDDAWLALAQAALHTP